MMCTGPFFGHVPRSVPRNYDVVQISRDAWGLDRTPAIVVPLTACALGGLADSLAMEMEDGATLSGATVRDAFLTMLAHWQEADEMAVLL